MMHAPGSVTSRNERLTRSNRTIPLERQTRLHRLIGSGLRAVESCATVLTFLLLSDAILPLFLHEAPNAVQSTDTTPIERACYWLAYAFTLSQVMARPRQLLRTALRNPFVLTVVLVAGLSIIWSDDPTISLKRTFALGMWTLFGFYVATRYDTSELLWHLGVALGIAAVLSIAVAVLNPDLGREAGFSGGAWRGVFTTKNTLGEMMLLAAVVFGTLLRQKGFSRAPLFLALVTAVALIALAKATAALLIVGVLIFTIPVVLLFRRNNAAAALIFTILLAVSAAGSIAIAEQQTVLSVLGKDPTLTGRTVLWQQVISRIEDRPLLGYGYGAFWAPAAATAERVRTAVDWDTPHSHNGLLDEWLDLGVAGVVFLLGAYLLALRRAWTGLRSSVGVDGIWAMTFLVMLFLGNTSESSITQSLLIWTVFVAVACMRWAPLPAAAARRAPYARVVNREGARAAGRAR